MDVAIGRSSTANRRIRSQALARGKIIPPQAHNVPATVQSTAPAGTAAGVADRVRDLDAGVFLDMVRVADRLRVGDLEKDDRDADASGDGDGDRADTNRATAPVVPPHPSTCTAYDAPALTETVTQLVTPAPGQSSLDPSIVSDASVAALDWVYE